MLVSSSRVRVENGPTSVFANGVTVVFFATAGWRSAPGYAQAVAEGELRGLISNLQAQPGLQWSNFEDGAGAVNKGVGTNMTANGYYPPDAGGATDISANSGKFRLVRPGYLVSLVSGSTRGDAFVYGVVNLIPA